MKTIRLIHTNDIHSSYNQFIKIASVIKTMRNNNSLILDAGDFNDFSSYITYGSEGIAGLKLLNHLKYDALTIGNNEGFQHIETIEKNCNSNLVNILSCNLFKEDGSKVDGLKSSIIKEIEGIRFLIIGVSPYMPSYNTYYNVYKLKALPPFDLIKNEIKDNKGKYDFVILLSHLGMKNDIIITQCIDNIDIIVSGHSHHIMDLKKINNTYIHQSGFKGNCVGYMDISVEDNNIIDVVGNNIIIDEKVKEDEETLILYNDLKEKAISNLSKPILTLKRNLFCKIDEECNLSNLLADYLYKNYDCDFSLINSGLTETNLYQGEISKLNILSCCNSPLYISTMFVKGKYIIDALNQSSEKEKCFDDYRRPGFRGKYLGKLHVSYNCKIKYKEGNICFFINNSLIENDKYYKIVTTDYFLRGMGYEILKNNINGKMYSLCVSEALVNALKDDESFEKIDDKRWENEE